MIQRIFVQAFKLITNEVNIALEKTYMIVIRVVDFRNNPIKEVNVKVFILENKPITIEQWGENLKNGSPFKRLILSKNSDATGSVTSELAEGSYEFVVEKFGSTKVCELKQNESVIFAESKKHWGQKH